MTIATRNPNHETNRKKIAKSPSSACTCGNAKKASKPTCSFCSFAEWIRGTKETIPTEICACGNPKEAWALSCSVCDEALRYHLDQRVKYEGLIEAKFLKSMRENHGIGIAGKCSLCGGNYIFGGNNPQPVIDDFDARCCDRCNDTVVSPARFDHIRKYGKAY